MRSRRDFLAATATGAVVGSQLLSRVAEAQAPQQAGAAPSGINTGGPKNTHTEFVLSLATDPYKLFDDWFQEAKQGGDAGANAMTLATADASGMPDARMMLLKEVREGKFLFTTFENSNKGKELRANPKAALLFYWSKLGRQVRVQGNVREMTAAEADEAWAKRGPRPYKLRDWAWPQSREIESAEQLEQRLAQMDKKFPGEVPRPDWTGYFVIPLAMEFFYPHSETGLHERLRFTRTKPTAAWSGRRLAP